MKPVNSKNRNITTKQPPLPKILPIKTKETCRKKIKRISQQNISKTPKTKLTDRLRIPSYVNVANVERRLMAESPITICTKTLAFSISKDVKITCFPTHCCALQPTSTSKLHLFCE